MLLKQLFLTAGEKQSPSTPSHSDLQSKGLMDDVPHVHANHICNSFCSVIFTQSQQHKQLSLGDVQP